MSVLTVAGAGAGAGAAPVGAALAPAPAAGSMFTGLPIWLGAWLMTFKLSTMTTLVQRGTAGVSTHLV